jgi:hypothetical protein
MNEQKLTEAELSELKKIQLNYQEKTFEFGQLFLDKLNVSEHLKELELRENKLKGDLILIQKSEQDWLDKITSIYGEGNLSLKDGTFTSKKKL